MTTVTSIVRRSQTGMVKSIGLPTNVESLE
jgi:hypothetical protein